MPNVWLPIVVLLTEPVPPVAVFAVPFVTALEPSATEPATLALALVPKAWALVALETAPSPIAVPKAPLTVEPRPTAIPDVAADPTDDCPPIAMPSDAADCAPFVALLPIAIAPAPDAMVEFAYESGVVPLPAAPPIATEFSAFAVEPKPRAVEPAPLAVVSSPAAVPHKAAELRKPMAVPPLPVTCE